jgi:hypothetical protein
VRSGNLHRVEPAALDRSVASEVSTGGDGIVSRGIAVPGAWSAVAAGS